MGLKLPSIQYVFKKTCTAVVEVSDPQFCKHFRPRQISTNLGNLCPSMILQYPKYAESGIVGKVIFGIFFIVTSYVVSILRHLTKCSNLLLGQNFLHNGALWIACLTSALFNLKMH